MNLFLTRRADDFTFETLSSETGILDFIPGERKLSHRSFNYYNNKKRKKKVLRSSKAVKEYRAPRG